MAQANSKPKKSVGKRRGTPGQALVPIDPQETRTEADFPLESRSPWRLQFQAVMEAWWRGSVNGGIDDGDFVRVARFENPQSAGRYLKRFTRPNKIVPKITDPTGETVDGDNVWAIKTAVVRNDNGDAIGSELWVAIVPNDDDLDDGDSEGDDDDE